MDDSFQIRKLSYAHKHRLGVILSTTDDWKSVMGHIPSKLKPGTKRFTSEDISLIERAARETKQTPMELLIDEWGTMDEKMATLADLKQLCLEVNAIAAASYINNDILANGPIHPENALHETMQAVTLREVNGAAAIPDFDEELLESELLADDENSDFVDNPIAPENNMPTHRVPIHYLATICDNFSQDRILGTGGFASVYLGITKRSKFKMAIKRLKSSANEKERQNMMQQLNYEVDTLPRIRHPNIIDLLGYSNDEPQMSCLLYEFMPNGTLAKKLSAKSKSEALTAQQRLVIAKGVAEGIRHLHSQNKILIHRDIKPSNILLANNFQPKLADFGLLRYGVSGSGESVSHTQAAGGTPAYMPPEATRGDVSAKWDVWSFGVVLLELLSGLPVLDVKREEQDLVTFVESMEVEEGFSADQLFDRLADWTRTNGDIIYSIARKCLEYNKKTRPSMVQIMDQLNRT